MGPYELLGVPPNCTRAQAKEAFRDRARSAHPDKGGDIPAFIELRRAYEAIVAELDRLGAAADHDDPRAAPPSRTARPPDPNWAAELVISDVPPGRKEPARPPDPNWEADFLIFDAEPSGPAPGPPARPAGRRDNPLRFWRSLDRSRDRGSSAVPAWVDWFGVAVLVLLLVLLYGLFFWAVMADRNPGAPPERGHAPAHT